MNTPLPGATARPTLLLVDDQPANIQVLYQALSADYRVLMATGGAQALQLCRSQLPDLVLLDVVMPDMDGHAVCKALKADPATRAIPVIFVTAQDDAAHETLGLALGAVDFIAKPANAAVVRARVHTHLAFARSNAWFAATQEAAVEGLLVTDAQGGIRHVNAAFVRTWGVPAELIDEAARAGIFAFMEEQALDRGLFRRQWAAALQQPPDGFETLELKGDRHVECRGRPFRINASLGGHVFSFRDVSERKRAARQLQALNETLELRILERTRELEVATHRAEAASRAKSDFLSNMSHEIRTPINGVVGLAHLALRGPLEPPLRDNLQKIRDAGMHLLGIVNDILDFSKIEAGRMDIEAIDFRLAEVFASVSSQVCAAAEAKGLALVFQRDPALDGALHGDPLRIGQVLLNYVGNAIKFSQQGSVIVRAAPLRRDDGAALVHFEVRDSGIGMSEAQVAELFQSFHQVDMSTTRRHGGTGLGLAISKRLAALMGGEVGVHSRPGQGSTFWFTARLPAAEAMPHPAAPAAQVPLDVLDGARILLVEDNPLNREVACGLLQDVGVEVHTAENGREALDRLAHERFDGVLMDVQMPVMDGLQATRLIRADTRLAGLPVLAMTANARPEDRRACLDAGMDDFMTTPMRPEPLYACLARWLSARAGRAAAAPSAPPAGSGEPPGEAAVPAGDPDVVDLTILARSVAGNDEKFRRYAGMFVAAIPETVSELEATLARGDLPQLAALGHRLKASSRMVGALGFARLCETLEGLRDGGSLAQAGAIVRQMPGLLARVAADIDRSIA
jgi:two-component system sensor histidine kinase/response regulator